jgi:hypothetical protein
MKFQKTDNELGVQAALCEIEKELIPLLETFDVEVMIKKANKKRSLDANAIKSVWYRDIAKYREDVSIKDVERECKLKYGVTILRADPANNWIYERSIDKLPYEKKLVIMDRLAVTSQMNTKQMNDYLECMKNDYPFLKSNKE